MRELYEDLRDMLLDNQKEVMELKAKFKKEVKALTSEAKRYKVQLNEYGKLIERNIVLINDKIKNLKED